LNAPGALEEFFSTLPHHHLLILPKFHPELNAIERVWGKMKLIWGPTLIQLQTERFRLRRGSLRWLRLCVTPTLFQKYFMLCDRWVRAYCEEEDVVKVEQLVKRKSSHRGIVESVEWHLIKDLLRYINRLRRNKLKTKYNVKSVLFCLTTYFCQFHFWVWRPFSPKKRGRSQAFIISYINNFVRIHE